jgi:hypothetical protein
MKRPLSSRFFGSCVIAGTLLSLALGLTLHVLRPDYDPLRNFCSEYLVGPYSFLGTASVFVVAATLLMLLIGLRFSVCRSGFLTASCVLLGTMAFLLCVCAIFPIDVFPPDGRLPAFTSAGIIHIVASVLALVSLIALLFTLTGAYKRDEQWRSFSQMTPSIGSLILVSVAAFILAPFYLRGLAQRVTGLPVLAWLFLTGLRLREAAPEALVKGALWFVKVVILATLVAAAVFRILSSIAPH